MVRCVHGFMGRRPINNSILKPGAINSNMGCSLLQINRCKICIPCPNLCEEGRGMF